MKLVLSLVFLATLAAQPTAMGQTSNETKVILTIDGNVTGGQAVHFTRSEIEALGLKKLRTSTPWHNGVQEFEGVPLSAVLRKVGATGAKVNVFALNKYRTEIPLADLDRHAPLLALKNGGQYMEIRDKGPLFIMYPFDEKPEIKIEQYYGRAAWQVRSMTVE